MFACSLQTCFQQARGEAISHLRGILATAIPRRGSCQLEPRDESAEAAVGGSPSWSRPLPSPAWPPRLGHCFGTDVPEHIPGTGQYRRLPQLKGFSLLHPLPLPLPTPTLLFFLLTARPKHSIHEFKSDSQMAGVGSRGAGTQELPRPKPARGAGHLVPGSREDPAGDTELCLRPMGQKCHCLGLRGTVKVLACRELGCDSGPQGMGQGVT